MPTLATEERLIPRSALRHRPISQKDVPPWVPSTARRQTRRIAQGDQKGRSQAVDTPATGSKNTVKAKRLEKSLPQHWLVYVGVGMLIAILLVSLGQVFLSWYTITLNDIEYGRPRTFHIDAFVGHEANSTIPSHFMAVNMHGRIEIIEFPGGDASKSRIFLGPQLSGQDADLVLVTLQFVDTRKDHHPDMLVLFHGTQALFRNEKGTFQAA